MEEENPKPNEIWTHNNGIEYLVKYIANDGNNPKYPLTIVYQGMKNGKIWTRELSDWHRSFKKKRLRQGYRFFECEICGYSWKEKSRDAKSLSGSPCLSCWVESHPIGHEIDGTVLIDEYGNLI